SLPWISRMVSGPAADNSPEVEAIPIEIVVEEEVVQQTPDPEPEPPEENPEPAASAERPSAAPLATNTEPIPTREVAASDTVAVAPAIATTNGEVNGQGAVGESSAVGLVTGSGEPTESSDRINLPDIAAVIEPELSTRPREAVQDVALRSPTSRLVSCNPCTTPDYPESARREEIEGQPTINVIFDSSGRVTDAVVETSSGNAAFDRAALEEATRNWRFQDGQGLGGQVSVDVTYVIDDSDQYGEARQAGEVRAVDLPTNQQIRSVAPDQPSAASNSAPSNSTQPDLVPSNSAPSNSAPSNSASTPEPVSDSPATESTSTPAQTESAPTAVESITPEPAAPEPTAESITPEPAAPEPAALEPVVTPSAPPIAPLSPPVLPAPPTSTPTTPPDILPPSDAE
ncbi:MAG: energy transducer TonB, partial [Cyanobacteria bacterium J06560_2]